MFDNIGLLLLTVAMIANLAIDTWKNPNKTHLEFFILNPLLLPINAIVIAAMYWLWNVTRMIQNEWLQALMNWSWLQAIFGVSSSGMWVAPLNVPVLGVVFGLLLVASLPRLAMLEEEWFRQGTDSWNGAFWRSVAFGLIHALVGVPLWGCIAIFGAGLVYTMVYWRYGLEQAARLHFQHNLIVIGIVATSLLLA